MSWLLRARRLRRKVVRRALNRVRAVARRGNYWRWVEAPDLEAGIRIQELVCPLRYDVIVRRDFFAFYGAHREHYRADPQGFVALARRGSYYTWFMKSEVARHPDARDDARALEEKFVDRVHRAAGLYESVRTRGFDPRHPIELKTAERLLAPTQTRSGPATGKRLSDRYFIGDGCHRLALRMALGQTVLAAEQLRVRRYRELSPFDSTSLLVRALPIDGPAYFRFLSHRYCAPAVYEDRERLLAHVGRETPGLQAEVAAVIDADGMGPGAG